MGLDFRSNTFYTAAINLAKNATRDVISAPGAKKQLWIFGLDVVPSADGNITFLDSTVTLHTGVIPVKADVGIVWPISANPSAPWIMCATNTIFQVTLTTNTDLDGLVVYAIVDA